MLGIQNVSKEIPLAAQNLTVGEGIKPSNTEGKLTAEESKALQGFGGEPDPIGDVSPRKTPQAGEEVKIVAKDAKGGHHYVYDEIGNQYEVDKKTYNSLKKGKGFVDGGQLKPIIDNAPQPIKKKIDVLKGEQSQARRKVQKAVTEAESAINSQENIADKKEAIKKEYKAAQKEMKEARKALTEAIKQPGADIKAASQKFKEANSKFNRISLEYKSVMTELSQAIGRTTRAKKTLDNAQKRSTTITQERNAKIAEEKKAKAEYEQKKAEMKAAKDPEVQAKKAVDETRKLEGKPPVGSKPPAVEAPVAKTPMVEQKPIVTQAENAAEKAAAQAEGTVSKNKGLLNKTGKVLKGINSKFNGLSKGGKLGFIAAIGLGVIVAGIALFGSKEDERTVQVSNNEEEINENKEIIEDGLVDETEPMEDEINIPTTPSNEELAAEQAENDADMAEVAADEAELGEPIIVKEGDNPWKIVKRELTKKLGRTPSNQEIADELPKFINLNDLKYESDGCRVLIHVNQSLKNSIK